MTISNPFQALLASLKSNNTDKIKLSQENVLSFNFLPLLKNKSQIFPLPIFDKKETSEYSISEKFRRQSFRFGHQAQSDCVRNNRTIPKYLKKQNKTKTALLSR